VRYYVGVDWADQTHAVWVGDERGTKITARTVPHTAEGMTEWGRELDEWRAQGLELWAAIERPEGRVVDFLLDHGVVVYPVNPKALDRARDRFRQSAAKSDPFDARVLADFLRTDHPRLRALQPSSAAAQELKLLTEDCQRQIRQQTRLVNQLTATLKAYYPRGGPEPGRDDEKASAAVKSRREGDTWIWVGPRSWLLELPGHSRIRGDPLIRRSARPGGGCASSAGRR
jgi:transposase